MNPARHLTNRARRLLPDGVERSVREVLLRWGIVTARGRLLPEVIIVGAQRSGTTTLFRLLSEHPQVTRPSLSKGTAYFDLHYDKSFRWYRGHFPLRLTAWLRSKGKRRITFESCGYYMFHPLAAERIAERLPGVKIVVLLRDPVERAYSAHRHELRRGFETLAFDEAIRAEAQRIEGEEERLVREPYSRSFEHQHHAYLARSRYFDQVERLLGIFGHDRVRVMDAEALFADPGQELGDLCRWLGLEPPRSVPMTQWNAEPREPLSTEQHRLLADYFRPHDEKLEWLLGRPLSWQGQTATR
jgi:hypothetical protein